MSALLKMIEQERIGFCVLRLKMYFEALPCEESNKLQFLGIPKECDLRQQFHVIAAWLNPRNTMSFKELDKMIHITRGDKPLELVDVEK